MEGLGDFLQILLVFIFYQVSELHEFLGLSRPTHQEIIWIPLAWLVLP